MRLQRRSYTAYSIGCAIAWAAVLGILAARGEKEKLRRVLPVLGGWWLGWTSATIARYVSSGSQVSTAMGPRPVR